MNSEIPFHQLGLSPEILEIIEKKGFKFASEIQAKSIPVILEESHDIIGIAQTGTGKTAAFGLPLIDRIIPDGQHVKCIILTPTRELAIQVATELESFKGKKQIKTLPVYGGQPIFQQIKDLRKGVDIVVGTPGRVMDLIKRGILDLKYLEYFVLDEADEMLKMGFIDDIESILKDTPDHKRVFLYSATIPPKIQTLSKKYMKEQVVLEVKVKTVQRANIQQFYYKIRRSEKQDAIKNIIELAEGFHGIIFCQTKEIVNELSDVLKREKLNVDCIHGDISQDGREKILKKFKDRTINILIATDVAARGLDIDDLTHVINYSLPQEIDSYVHRIGRTGRANKKGIAMTFIDPREEYKINRLIRETKNDILPGELPSGKEVAQKRLQKLVQTLEEIMNTKDTSFYATLSKDLVQTFGDAKVIAALLYQINGSGVVEKIKQEPSDERRDSSNRGYGGRGRFDQKSERGRKGSSRDGRSSGKHSSTGNRSDNAYGKIPSWKSADGGFGEFSKKKGKGGFKGGKRK